MLTLPDRDKRFICQLEGMNSYHKNAPPRRAWR
jgi:hypothetical protein